VDALLLGSAAATGAAPALLSVAGIFTNPQFQVVLRALNQQKGVDLVSAPKVTTKSGQRATIQIVREFRYPTEYDLPQVTQTPGSIYTPDTDHSASFETNRLATRWNRPLDGWVYNRFDSFAPWSNSTALSIMEVRSARWSRRRCG
jgi:hypothetical protein